MVRVAKLELPLEAVTDNPIVCIPINRSWLRVLLSAIARLELKSAWVDGTDYERADQQILTLALMLVNATECENGMFDVRQNPLDPCLLEKTTTGTVWEQFANIDLCVLPQTRVRQTSAQPCVLEYSLDDGQTWQPFADLQQCPPLIRVVQNAAAPGGFQIQSSSDGGQTWAPFQTITLDPIGDNPPAQVIQPADARCNAARNAMLAYFNLAWLLAAQNDALPDKDLYIAVADFLPVLRDRLNYFIGGDVFANIVTNTSLSLGLAAYLGNVRASKAPQETIGFEIRNTTGFDLPNVQAAIQCAFYCVADENGVIDFQAALAKLQTLVDEATIQIGARNFIEMLGAGTLAAAASARIVTVGADGCADCDCGEVCNPITFDDPTCYTIFSPVGANTIFQQPSIDPAFGNPAPAARSAYYSYDVNRRRGIQISLSHTFDTPVDLASISFDWYFTDNRAGGCQPYLEIQAGATTLSEGEIVDADGQWNVFTRSGTWNGVTSFRVWVSKGGNPGDTGFTGNAWIDNVRWVKQ